MIYTPPNNDNINFKFKKLGYKPQNSNSISFSLGMIRGVEQISANITALNDYLKSREVYALGYNKNKVQILKHGYLYSGIRNLESYIYGVSSTLEVDLKGVIKAWYSDNEFDLSSILWCYNNQVEYNLKSSVRGRKLNVEFNLRSSIKTLNVQKEVDLFSYIKLTNIEYKNINGYIKNCFAGEKNIKGLLKGYSRGNVVDLKGPIRSWGSEFIDLPSYIKLTRLQIKNLSALVFKIWYPQSFNINALLQGYQLFDIGGILQSFHTVDLSIDILITHTKNIGAFLYAVGYFNLNANIIGWKLVDLAASLFSTKYPYNISATICSVDSMNLKGELISKKGIGIISDLNAIMTNLQVRYLPVNLNIVYYRNLNAYLMSSRQKIDLQAKIYPKVIHIKHHINIAFLENRDLLATINYSCISSSFKDIMATLYIKHGKDLKTYIYGYDSSNIADLSCSINASEYLSQDITIVKYINLKRPTSSIFLSYKKKSKIYSINTISVFDYAKNKDKTNLSSTIIGQPFYKNLSAYITTYINRDYTSLAIKQKVIVLDLKNSCENFRRYANVAFSDYAQNYYYYSGNQKVYREIMDEHWVIYVKGYKLLPVGEGYEKTKVKRKYVFNLSNYNTIDDAIKDMIDRVTVLKSINLKSYINSITDKVIDLSAFIKAHKKYKTNRTIKALIKVVNLANINLTSNIVGELFNSLYNLNGSIMACENVNTGIVNFDFINIDGEFIPPNSDAANFIFGPGDNNGSN